MSRRLVPAIAMAVALTLSNLNASVLFMIDP